MEQWQIDAINKCAKDGSLPKGIAFNKAQIGAMLGVNPAAFILLVKENFLARTAPDADSYTTTDRWDNLKKAGSCEALLASEKPAEAPKPPVAEVAPKQPASAPVPVPEAKPAVKETPKAAFPEAAAPKPQAPAITPPTPAPKPAMAAPEKAPLLKERPAPQLTPATPTPPLEGMDLVTIIGIIGAVIGILIVAYSLMKK